MSTTASRRVQREAKVAWVPLKLMRVSPHAQRALNQAWVDQLVANFQLEAMRKPVVNRRRDGHFYIIDGQHTVAALKQWLGEWESQQIECEVYTHLTEKEEAAKFDQLNTRKAVQALDRFRVRVVAGHAVETTISSIVADLGLKIGTNNIAGSISAVGTLRRVYDRSDGPTLARALRIIRDAFGDPGLEAPVIDGLGYLCARYNGQLVDDDVVARLGSVHGGVGALMGRANLIKKQLGKPLGQCVAAAAVDILNRGKGGKKLAPWWKAGDL